MYHTVGKIYRTVSTMYYTVGIRIQLPRRWYKYYIPHHWDDVPHHWYDVQHCWYDVPHHMYEEYDYRTVGTNTIYRTFGMMWTILLGLFYNYLMSKPHCSVLESFSKPIIFQDSRPSSALWWKPSADSVTSWFSRSSSCPSSLWSVCRFTREPYSTSASCFQSGRRIGPFQVEKVPTLQPPPQPPQFCHPVIPRRIPRTLRNWE